MIHTKKPDPLLPARLAFYGGQIVPKKYLESVGNDAFNAKPVGTGPVRFTSWVEGRQGRPRGQPGLLGRQDRHRPLDHAADPGDGAAHRRAAQGRGRRDHPAPARSGRAGGRQRRPRGSRARSTPGLYVLGGEQQAAAAGQPARQAGAVAGHRPRGDREGAVARARHRAERPHRQGRQPLRREPAAAGLQPDGGEGAAQEGGLQGRGDLHRDHRRPTSRRTRRCPRPSRPCGRTSASTSKVEVIEYSVRAQKNREKSFKGVFWSDPDVDPERSRRDDVAPARAGRPAGLLARGQVRRAGQRRALLASTRSSGARPTRR